MYAKFAYASQKMYLCQHGVTLKYVSPIEIEIIGGAQFKNMLKFSTVPLLVLGLLRQAIHYYNLLPGIYLLF